MKAVKLNRDTRPQEQEEGTYPYGKNGVHDYFKNAVMNEPGFLDAGTVFPYTPMGLILTDDKPIIMSTDDTSSAIGYFNHESGAYEPATHGATT